MKKLIFGLALFAPLSVFAAGTCSYKAFEQCYATRPPLKAMIRILCAVRSRETEGAFSTENFSECQVLGKSYGQYVVVTYTETGEPRSSSAEVYRDSN